MKFKLIFLNLLRFSSVLFLVTFGITLLVRLLPGDPVSDLLPFANDADRAKLSDELGLDLNVVEYYFRWAWDFVRGDFGTYYASTGDGGGADVSAMLAVALPRSLLLMLYVIILSLLVSIPLGLLMAYRSQTRTDNILSNLLFALYSIPNFALGLGLAYVVGVRFDLLPVIGYMPISEGFGEHLKSLLLPTICLSVGIIALFSRLLRADLIATLREDFVTMAASKGLSNSWILWRHVLRPSSSTLFTAAALQMGGLIGGSVVIETVFALNGLGMLLSASIATRQYLAIQSLVALIAVAYLVFNLIVDLFYAVVDPRVASHRGA